MTSRGKNIKKKSNQNKLKEFYADDMVDETEQKSSQIPRNKLIEEDEDEEDDQVNLDDDKGKEVLKKQNMDKISDILSNLIMKNKLNSKNAFDVPLPDVKQLSDFNQATGENLWKKFSQTLDAGARIYGFRVDSVHNEAYKVLGGLNRTELKEAVQEAIQREEEEHQVRKKKEHTDGEETLEKNTANIDANKYDLEFDVDPLFQKTSAKFDEGGAKGLLLNNLSINNALNLMFDSDFANDNADILMSNRVPLSFASLTKEIDTLTSDLYHAQLCPELRSFKEKFLKDSTEFIGDITFVEKSAKKGSSQQERSLQFENVDIDAEQFLNQLGENPDPELNASIPIDKFQFNEEDAQISGNYLEDTNNLEFASDKKNLVGDNDINFINIQEKLASLGAGASLNTFLPDHKTWMGPESWKIKSMA